MKLLFLTVALSLVTATAAADSIGGVCPSGEIYQTNPTEPGAMHHSGGQCVPDPNASHCSASPGRARTSGVAFAGGALVLAVAFGRRVRVRAR